MILISTPIILVKLNILISIPQYVLSTISWSIALTILITHIAKENYLYKDTQHKFLTPIIAIVNTMLWFLYGIFTEYGLNTIALDLSWYLIQSIFFIVFTTLVETIRKLLIEKIIITNKLLSIILVSVVITLVQIVFQKNTDLSTLQLFNTVVLFEINIVLTYIALSTSFREQLAIALTYTFLYKLSPIQPVLDVKMEHMFKEIMVLTTLITIYIYSLKTNSVFHFYNESIILNTSRFRNKISKLLNIVLTSFLIIVLVFFIIGFRGLTVVTKSMHPVINQGDLVIISTIDKNIDKNDIIAFVVSNRVIIHRVFDKTIFNGETVYLTKGDANTDIDPWILRENNIVGKVVLIIPYIGLPSMYYTLLSQDRTLGIGFITVFISLFTIIYLIHKIMLIKYE